MLLVGASSSSASPRLSGGCVLPLSLLSSRSGAGVVTHKDVNLPPPVVTARGFASPPLCASFRTSHSLTVPSVEAVAITRSSTETTPRTRCVCALEMCQRLFPSEVLHARRNPPSPPATMNAPPAPAQQQQSTPAARGSASSSQRCKTRAVAASHTAAPAAPAATNLSPSGAKVSISAGNWGFCLCAHCPDMRSHSLSCRSLEPEESATRPVGCTASAATPPR
mmetsp:Transcript_3987/g.13975  ORF Transcript_3987/g.13975 Transcript_3987/m.13975 type:complete len:223 (+) Transcript_3987:362-1030(+)